MTLLLLLVVLTLLTLDTIAFAKEGVITKLDELPISWHAGQTYAIGHTIRVNGTEPFKTDRTEIIANTLDGRTNLVFPGVAEGNVGRYIAQVTFPSARTYRWKVTPGTRFEPMDLGRISVLAAIATTGAAAGAGGAGSDPLPYARPFAAAAVVVFGTLVRARTRSRRQVNAMQPVAFIRLDG